jgi:uncharacterized membrane protein YhhN
MLSKPQKTFSILFFILLLFELITNHYTSLQPLHYIAKPLLLIALLVFFTKQSQKLHKSVRILTSIALVCSLFGDVFLMFDDQNQLFFILGLVAFLIAHIFYVLVFLKHRNTNKSPYLFITALILYANTLFYFIKSNLGDLLIPVVVYMLVILSMATTAFMRHQKVNSLSFSLVLLGAFFFLISDSLLSLNLFYKPLPLANISIMTTYALAQYLIVIGILKLNATEV